MKPKMFFVILVVTVLFACNGPFNVGIDTSSPNATPITASATSTTVIEPSSTNPVLPISSATSTIGIEPSSTSVPVAVPSGTLTPFPNNTLAPTITSMPASGTFPAAGNYVDDRSTPSQVIVSYYNAVNRKEYLRAYSYWRDPSTAVGSYSSFAAGYSDTASVDLVFGQITGDRGMSQYYYTVPVILKTTSNTSVHTHWAACYVVHATVPEVFGAPPFEPMAIDRGAANPIDINASDATGLANACSGYPGGQGSVPVGENPLNIDKSNFLDNRSGPIETVSSLLNSLNLKQYVRAYYYFQDPSNFPGTYDSYAAGFSDTDLITVMFGTVQSQGAAGSLYFKVPLAMKVLTTSSTTQTFVGCYTLRLTQPAVQGTPPFQPMGIIAAKFKQVANATDVNAQLPTACN